MDDKRPDDVERVESPWQGQDQGMEDLHKLFGFLERMLEEASAVPLTSKRLVNVDSCLDVIDNIKENLPDAVLNAEAMLAKYDQIIGEGEQTVKRKLDSANARADSAIKAAEKRADEIERDAHDKAERYLEDAEHRARAAVDQSEIVRRATAEADEILNKARADANDQRLSASQYADTLISTVEDALGSALDALRKTRQNLSKM